MAAKDDYFGTPLRLGPELEGRRVEVDADFLRPKVYPKTPVEVQHAPGVDNEYRCSALMWSYADEVRYGAETRVVYDHRGEEIAEFRAKISEDDIKALAELITMIYDRGRADGAREVGDSIRKLIGAPSYADTRPVRFGGG